MGNLREITQQVRRYSPDRNLGLSNFKVLSATLGHILDIVVTQNEVKILRPHKLKSQ